MLGNGSRAIWLAVVGLVLLFLDFFTKAYVYYVLPLGSFNPQGIPVFRDLFGIDFAINLTTNRGAAWGLFADFQILLLIVRILVIVGMVCYLLFFNRNRAVTIPLTLVCIGAVGNVVDFFLYGFVIDLFQFHFWGYPFPLFNVADSIITIGVVWLFFVAFCKKRSHENS